MNNPVLACISISLLLLASALFATEPVFYRGVNLGGPAITINNSHWDGDDAKDLVCTDRALVLKTSLRLKPETNDALATMLHSFRWNRTAQVRLTNIPPDVYTVWLYAVEDNSPETYNISIEGIPAVRGFNSGPQGTWHKVGPMIVEVNDGAIDLTTYGGAANLCGVEVWKGAAPGVEPLRKQEAPVSPFLGKFANRKTRVLVMTDIGGDPDDQQSLVRYLLYACDFDTEDFAPVSGTMPTIEAPRPELIHKALDAYGKVVANLRIHNKDYPSVESLRTLVKDGYSGDMHKVGPGMDSESSDWIISAIKKDDPRPLWILAWGGPRELAQALWRMEQTCEPEELLRLNKKIRIYSIADQDRTADWIKQHHPDIFYLLSKEQFRGIYQYGDQSLVSPAWLRQNVLVNHGPLGNPGIYPPNASGRKGLKEGDTPSFLWVLRNGLNDPESPEWGNWGGRFCYSGVDSEFVSTQDMLNDRPDMYYTIWRWRTAYQNEFEARMDWCVKQYEQANHTPIAVCNGKEGVGIIDINAKPGEIVALSAAGSRDPDGDKMVYNWWVYSEAGSYGKSVAVEGASEVNSSVILEPDAAGKTIHLILEVTDDGKPPLTAYRRAVIKVSE